MPLGQEQEWKRRAKVAALLQGWPEKAEQPHQQVWLPSEMDGVGMATKALLPLEKDGAGTATKALLPLVTDGAGTAPKALLPPEMDGVGTVKKGLLPPEMEGARKAETRPEKAAQPPP